MLTRIHLQNFTAFEKLDLTLSPGINVLIGANGTGKTHILKATYAACATSGDKGDVREKLVRCFLPLEGRIGRLVHRSGRGRSRGSLEIWRGEDRLRVSFSTVMVEARQARVTGGSLWDFATVECAYIPVKEMLANAPGFRTLYNDRAIHFEEVYADIVDKAYRPPLRGPRTRQIKDLMGVLEKDIEGTVGASGEQFMWKDGSGATLEFTLLAEGLRKLGLLWLLVQNGTLANGSVLFWDEPEANLNPKLFRTVARVLVVLQRQGVQSLLATHSQPFLKELQLALEECDQISYHALFKDTGGKIFSESNREYQMLANNAIAEAMDNLFDRTIEGALAESKK